jgi:HK97 family phage prohead protease
MIEMEVDFVALVEGSARDGREKTGPALQECQALFVKSIDKKSRRITALASAGTLDRDGEIIEPEAFRKWLPVYLKNPIVITSHLHRLQTGNSSTIGNVIEAVIDKNGLTVVIEFHCLTALSEEYWLLYSQKKQRAFSVGFIPHESEYRQVGDGRVLVHTEIEMVEISCVVVGSNREALSKAKQHKADFVAAKKTGREDDKILAELWAGDPDFDKKADEFAELLSDFDGEGEMPEAKGGGQAQAKPARGQAKLAAFLLKTDRELALVFEIEGPYRRYLKYTQAMRQGIDVGHYGLDEIELYKAVESGDIDVFIEVVKSKIMAIAGNAEPDYAAIVSGAG